MGPLFKVEEETNRKMWYEVELHDLQKKGFVIFRLIFACYCGLRILFMIASWIKDGQIVWFWKDIVPFIGFILFLTLDRLAAFLISLNLQRLIRKRFGVPSNPTSILFYEEYMEWSDIAGRSTVLYTEMTDIQVTKAMYIITSPKAGCRFLVSKQGFVIGAPFAFEQFIKSKIPH